MIHFLFTDKDLTLKVNYEPDAVLKDILLTCGVSRQDVCYYLLRKKVMNIRTGDLKLDIFVGSLPLLCTF